MGFTNKSAASNGYSNHNRALTIFADETTGNVVCVPDLVLKAQGWSFCAIIGMTTSKTGENCSKGVDSEE